MVFGWSLCTVALIVLSLYGLPEPYWCVGDDGRYVTKTEDADGNTVAAEPCNAHAAKMGGR